MNKTKKNINKVKEQNEFLNSLVRSLDDIKKGRIRNYKYKTK